MKSQNDEREKFETYNNNSTDNFGVEEFQKVPIQHSIEVINIINNMNKMSNMRFKKKFYKTFLIIVVIVLFLYITKRYLYDGIVQIVKDESNQKDYDDIKDREKYIKDREKYIKDFYNKSYEGDIDLNSGEIFNVYQKKENIDLNSFSSPQLRNPKNIKLIEKLEITVDVEYDKFVHLKIKDSENKRWEIPEYEVLNKDYLNDKNDNRISLSKYTRSIDSQNFYLELLSRNNDEENEQFKDEHPLQHYYTYNNTEEFSFRLMNNDNKQFYYFNTSQNFLYSDTYINFESKITSEDIYGFGERTHDFKLNEGTYTIWSHDCSGTKYDDGKGGMNQYSHQPIGLHKTKYENLWVGFVFLNTNAQDVVIKYSNNDTNDNNTEVNLIHKTIGGIIDYYIIVDNSPEEVIKNIQFLLGIPTLPPFWSLGNHQCRYGYKTFEDFKEVYNNYKKYEIPIDVMWIDIDAMDNFEIFTLNKKFEKLSPFINDEFHKEGGKFIPIIDLGLSYENKDNKYVKLGNSLDIFIKSNYTKKPLITKVWPGKTVFPDFFNPNIEKFWNEGLEDYYKLVNYDGIWLDMNEPASLLKNSSYLGEILEEKDFSKDKNKYNNEDLPYLPGFRNGFKDILSNKSISENALVYGDLTIYDVKPLIAYYESKYTFDFLKENKKKRPFILSRSTTLGSGKYSFHWLGDNHSSYKDLKYSISGIFNFNIFGIPFSGADICGFFRNSNKDLCIRWYNLGIFYPFMRNHNSKKSNDQFPWSFDNNKKEKYDSIQIIKKNINFRYSLLRYIYSQLFLISLNEKGSFFKPVMFEFPEEKNSFEDIESKVMFGEAFLLCVFYNISEDEKIFGLPDSNFNEYPSGKNIMNYGEDNNTISLSGKLDLLHVFLRGGYIIPYQNTFDKYILNSLKLREEKLNLIININNIKQSKGIIFFDNDGIDTIKNREYCRVDLFFIGKKLNVKSSKNKMKNYNFNDHILGAIELWRINEIFEMDKEESKKNQFSLKIIYDPNLDKKEEIIEGKYDRKYNKAIFKISKGDKNISIFDIDEILFN